MDEIELKHCPFCGGSADFLHVWAPKYEEEPDNRWRAKCRGECGNCGEVKIGKYAADEAWNRRAPLPADKWRVG